MIQSIPQTTSYRWRICALLFLATTICYVDRNVLSFTMIDDFFRREMLGLPVGAVLTDTDIAKFKELMGYVDGAFKAAYAIGFLLVGYFIDRIGTKRGFSLSLLIWSTAGVLNGIVGSVRGLGAVRFMLGIGESGNFPSAVKAVAEWFPKKERSLATGLFNAGANVGIVLTAISVPYITIHYGWRAAFVLTGVLGFVVLGLWMWDFLQTSRSASIGEYSQSCNTYKVMMLHRIHGAYPGPRCFATDRRGLFAPANSLPTPSGIFTSLGCPTFLIATRVCNISWT